MADDDRIYMIDDLPIHHAMVFFSTSLYVKLPESNIGLIQVSPLGTSSVQPQAGSKSRSWVVGDPQVTGERLHNELENHHV